MAMSKQQAGVLYQKGLHNADIERVQTAIDNGVNIFLLVDAIDTPLLWLEKNKPHKPHESGAYRQLKEIVENATIKALEPYGNKPYTEWGTSVQKAVKALEPRKRPPLIQKEFEKELLWEFLKEREFPAWDKFKKDVGAKDELGQNALIWLINNWCSGKLTAYISRYVEIAVNLGVPDVEEALTILGDCKEPEAADLRRRLRTWSGGKLI